MKAVSLLVGFVLFLSRCSEPEPAKRVYTEKDIEGYWATYSTMYPSDLGSRLSVSSELSLEYNFLRLYNNVCGLADTVYKIKCDTIYLLERDYSNWREGGQFKPRFTIEFCSKERIVLYDFEAKAEITFYSLMELPESNEMLSVVSYLPPHGGSGLEWREDSVKSIYKDYDREIIYCSPPTRIRIKSDVSSFDRLNELYQRISNADILFASSPMHSCKSNAGTNERKACIEIVAAIPSHTLNLRGTRGNVTVGSVIAVANPVLRAFYLELNAIEMHFSRKSD